MGLFEKIFPKKAVENQYREYFKTLTAYTPIFTNWSGAIYESELIRGAVDSKARHISKLNVEFPGNEAMEKRLQRPNQWQTWSQFLYRLSTILEVQNTAFIVPMLDAYGRTKGIYPILPTMCEIRQDERNIPYLVYTFKTGNKAALELEKCGMLTKFQYAKDFFGENNNALSMTMELINAQNQGIMEGVKSAATYRFMANMSNFAKPDDLRKERERFTEENFSTEGGGILLFPNTYTNVKQIDSKPFIIDANQMKAIRENIFYYFGVNEDVMQNKAYGDAWSAFYEGCIEPFAVQLGEVLTRMFGTDVAISSNRLQYMTNADKLNVSAQMADRGVFNRDEVRQIWNLPPLPNGEGQEYIIRGEYKNANEQVNGGNEDAGEN